MAEENWEQMIIWNFFLLKSAWRGRIAVTIKRRTNRSTEEIAAAKKRAEERQFTHWFWWKPQNCLEKGHKSAARARNCRLRPRSSRSMKRHRLRTTGSPTGNSQIQIWRWHLSSPVRLCAQFCSPGLLSNCFFPLLLSNDYWKPSGKQKIYWLGDTDTSFRVVFFHIRISKAVWYFQYVSIL